MLADVVLPILHDRLISWHRARPDILQHMLLAGLAVDSPGDAAKLHPRDCLTPKSRPNMHSDASDLTAVSL